MVQISYEDEHCIVVSKPNNVLVHHAHHSRNKWEEASLLQLLEQQGFSKCYPIHRLDRKTSGILLLAKKTEYVSLFQKLFTQNRIQKVYYGVVRGFAPDVKIIDSPVKGRDADVYKEAKTHLKTLANITLDIPVKPYETSRYSLVELQPQTGRLHQLRIHMNKISHPLINDAKYGDKNHDLMYEGEFGWTNLFLHAGSLQFQHPFTQEELLLKAEFPKDWKEMFSKFNWKNPLDH
jgi:tRNA pseudouridine65 synthase